MRALFFALATILSGTAAAETKVITCTFTEPFYDITIDLVNKTVIKRTPDFSTDNGGYIEKLLAKNFKIRSTSTDPFLPAFEVLKRNRTVLLTLTMNFKGSNGMGPTVYPMEGQFTGDANTGGCWTDLIAGVEAAE